MRISKITFVTSSAISFMYEGVETTVEYDLISYFKDSLDEVYHIVVSNTGCDENQAEIALKWEPKDYYKILKKIRAYHSDKNITE